LYSFHGGIDAGTEGAHHFMRFEAVTQQKTGTLIRAVPALDAGHRGLFLENFQRIRIDRVQVVPTGQDNNPAIGLGDNFRVKVGRALDNAAHHRAAKDNNRVLNG
jgi:hypothetical protein